MVSSKNHNSKLLQQMIYAPYFIGMELKMHMRISLLSLQSVCICTHTYPCMCAHISRLINIFLQYFCFTNSVYDKFQVTWGRLIILSPLLSITCRVKDKLCYLLAIFLMLIDINIMMLAYVGILGVCSLSKVLHISLGFGLLETMK